MPLTLPAMMLPNCAFLPVSRLVVACSTVTGAWNAMLPPHPAQEPIEAAGVLPPQVESSQAGRASLR